MTLLMFSMQSKYVALHLQWETERAKRAKTLEDVRVTTVAAISGRIDDIGEDDPLSPIAAAMLAEGVTINDRGEYVPSDEIQTLLVAYTAMWSVANIAGLLISAYHLNGKIQRVYQLSGNAVPDAAQSLAQWLNLRSLLGEFNPLKYPGASVARDHGVPIYEALSRLSRST
jgi:hypothetical protein